MDPTTFLETIQTIINVLGLALSTYAFLDTIRTYREVQRRGIGNGRRIIAQSHVRAEGIRMLAQLVLVMTAMVSLYMPAPPAFMPYEVLQALVWRKMLVTFVSVLLIAQTMGDIWDRRMLYEIAVQRDRHKPPSKPVTAASKKSKTMKRIV